MLGGNPRPFDRPQHKIVSSDFPFFPSLNDSRQVSDHILSRSALYVPIPQTATPKRIVSEFARTDWRMRVFSLVYLRSL